MCLARSCGPSGRSGWRYSLLLRNYTAMASSNAQALIDQENISRDVL